MDPEIAINAIGFQYLLRDSLGQFSQNGRMMEVAGTVESDTNQIQISRQFPVSTRRFTGAHELGHALLHNAKGLHRDRPLDGSTVSGIRDVIEIQADKFASYFLMPEKLVSKIFKDIFYTDFFTLNEETLFALGSEVASKLNNKCDSRSLARTLAGVESFNGRHFPSLASQFGV